MNSTPICYPDGFPHILSVKQIWMKLWFFPFPHSFFFCERKRELEVQETRAKLKKTHTKRQEVGQTRRVYCCLLQALCFTDASSPHKNPKKFRPCLTLKPLLSSRLCCEDANLPAPQRRQNDNPSLMVSKYRHQFEKY